MFRYTPTLILLLTFFSCGSPQEVKNQYEDEYDYIMIIADSLLTIADNEMEYIRNHSNSTEDKIDKLEGKIDLYRYKLSNYENTHTTLYNVIDSLNVKGKEKDRIITSLKETIKNKDLIIKLNQKTINRKNQNLNDITNKCESEIEKLVLTVELLNDSINSIMETINNSLKPNKIEKVFN